MSGNVYDAIMVGGGVMSCATAYYLLKADPQLKVAIVEKDPTYAKCSAILSEGNLRVQFNIKENIQISQYGLEVLTNFAENMAVDDDKPDAAFRQEGNLFLIGKDNEEEAKEGLALQQSLGCQVEWLSPQEVKELYPLYELGDIAGGTFGQQDGTMDPWGVLMGYKNKAVSLGAHFIKDEVAQLLIADGIINGVALISGGRLSANIVFNGAGAWAPLLTDSIGISLPIIPVRRQLHVLETNAQPEGILPAIFFPSGMYLFHERDGHFTCGKARPQDPAGYNFDWNKNTFLDILWPELAEYLPIFEEAKVVRGWAGLYAVNTFDGNAILGEWPELPGLFLANGFSGHGFQQCHAVGRYLSELILEQQPTLELAIFSPQRILENKPVLESKRKIL